MQLGEAVTLPGEFLGKDTHDENVCPWHKKGSPKKKVMKAAHSNEDTKAMTPNDGGTLGQNMDGARKKRPDAKSVRLTYTKDHLFVYLVGKEDEEDEDDPDEGLVQSYRETKKRKLVTYKLQYAPHHLIPGNASLKNSAVVPFLGDKDTIAEFGKQSRIKEGFSTGYDVNASPNGAWLPSPYALSMANAWPSITGIKIIRVRDGDSLAGETEDFKIAYVAASIRASGNRQFHMAHKKYSDKVREVLKAIGKRLKDMAARDCPFATGNKENGKVDPPYGLVGRLNVLSANLNRLVTGPVWRDPLFTDRLSKEYIEDLVRRGKAKKTSAAGNIEEVL
jgi:hypothetical protein